MSYKNPKIIDDKSGLIVSQAIDNATATIGQGIVAFGAEEKRREEVRKREQERRDKIYIDLANEMANDSTLFNKGISKGSTELRNTLIPRNEMLLKRINDIKIQQQINGNRDPELSKELSNLRMQISNGNGFAESYIETASLLTKTMEDPQAFALGEKTFTMINGSQDESETIFNAVGGNPNYTTSFASDLSVIVTNKTTGQSFKNTREQFEAKAKNLYITKKNNTSVLQTKIMNDKIYNKDGGISPFLLEGQGDATMGSESDGKGYVARYKTQILNDTAVDNIKNALLDDTFAFVESFVGKQEQGLYLKDIGITGEDLKNYQNADKESRKRLLEGSRNLIFNKNSGITQEGGNYVIKKQIGNSIKTNVTQATQAEITDNTFVSKSLMLDPEKYLIEDKAGFDTAFKSTYPPPQMYNNNKVVGIEYTNNGFKIKMEVPKVKVEPKAVGATELKAAIASDEKFEGKEFGNLTEAQQREVREIAEKTALEAAMFANTDGQTEEVFSPEFLYQNSTHMQEYMSLTASSKGTPTLTGYTNAANNIGNYFTTISK